VRAEFDLPVPPIGPTLHAQKGMDPGGPARTAQRVASFAYGSLASEAYQRSESGWNSYE
jgi:hypothetical protein